MNKKIYIKNIEEIKVKVLQSTVYTTKEKFDIIRHKYTNYDELAKTLPKLRIKRTKEYKILVEDLLIQVLRQFPQLKQVCKDYYINKLR